MATTTTSIWDPSIVRRAVGEQDADAVGELLVERH